MSNASQNSLDKIANYGQKELTETTDMKNVIFKSPIYRNYLNQGARIVIGDISVEDYSEFFRPVLLYLFDTGNLDKVISLNPEITKDISQILVMPSAVSKKLVKPTDKSYKMHFKQEKSTVPSFIYTENTILLNRTYSNPGFDKYEKGKAYVITLPKIRDHSVPLLDELNTIYTSISMDVHRSSLLDNTWFHNSYVLAEKLRLSLKESSKKVS